MSSIQQDRMNQSQVQADVLDNDGIFTVVAHEFSECVEFEKMMMMRGCCLWVDAHLVELFVEIIARAAGAQTSGLTAAASTE